MPLINYTTKPPEGFYPPLPVRKSSLKGKGKGKGIRKSGMKNQAKKKKVLVHFEKALDIFVGHVCFCSFYLGNYQVFVL